MPANKTKSPLAKKYGQPRVVRARNLVQAKYGIKPGSEKDKDKIPWGLIGKIAQDEKKGGKLVKKSDIKAAQKKHKRKGTSPLMKKYFKQSKKKVSRETSKKRKK